MMGLNAAQVAWILIFAVPIVILSTAFVCLAVAMKKGGAYDNH